jgi:biopolymer transport protein ExbB/TolQ
METDPSTIAAGAKLGATIHDFFLHADPIVKGVMLLLALASVVTWAIVLEKLMRLGSLGAQVRRLEALASAPDRGADDRAWLAARLLASVRQAGASPEESRSETEARLEKAMRLAAGRELNRVQSRLRLLATVGSTAPFIGLLGTVWGIMNSFTAIAAQKNTSLAVVAPGIAEALFATALGLVAAIPAVIAYNQITGSISRSAERIHFAVAILANALSRAAAKTAAG